MATEKSIDPVEKALQTVALSYLPDQPTTEVVKMYDNTRWVTYDETMSVLKWKGPKVVGDAVARYLPDNRDVRVLDVAAGTGLVAEQLQTHGFNNIDALDPYMGMLNVARQKNIYRSFIQEYFPSEKPSVETSSYDVLVVAGGMSGGHMPCDCLPEMVRCVKTGGLVVISVTAKHLTIVPEYKDRFEPLMQQLEKEGQWQILERTIIDQIHHINDGLLFVLKVTKAEI